jgi:hypothetical protein
MISVTNCFLNVGLVLGADIQFSHVWVRRKEEKGMPWTPYLLNSLELLFDVEAGDEST